METVTGYVELKTEDTREVLRFIAEHLALLEDHQIEVRKLDRGYHVAFYDANEPSL